MVRIRIDKVLHFLAGMLVVSVCYPFIGWGSVLVLIGFSFGKEIMDRYGKHVSELNDALWTLYGGAIIYALFGLGGCLK